ncbi:MAG TPA: PfkB family carbohydrate kinase, partial [Gaiellaceae bacterium]|nr:PfkB family carbohydrate kinase [Gaiellaceae bacterium]
MSTVVCVGLATLDTIFAVPRHPGPDDRVVATELAIAGGGPAATAAVALARLGTEVAFVGLVGDD